MAILPQGTVTFLFTDIEGSTRLVQELGPGLYGEVLETHHALLRDAFRAGVDVGTEGDSFFVALASARGGCGRAARIAAAGHSGQCSSRSQLTRSSAASCRTT